MWNDTIELSLEQRNNISKRIDFVIVISDRGNIEKGVQEIRHYEKTDIWFVKATVFNIEQLTELKEKMIDIIACFENMQFFPCVTKKKKVKNIKEL